MRIEIVMGEFGEGRFNNGDGQLPADRLEPSLSSFLRHFPEATATVYTDQDWQGRDRVEVRKVDPPFDRKHGRYGNRCNDLYQAIGLLESKADFAIAVDSDLLIVNDDVRTIMSLMSCFGLAMPTNGRRIAWRDAASDCDGGRLQGDSSNGCGACRCTAFWAFPTDDDRGRKLLQRYCEQIVYDAEHGCGARGPLSLYRAERATGIFPYSLPAEWCITGSTMGDVTAKGRTVPIIIHVGHEQTKVHYADLIARMTHA